MREPEDTSQLPFQPAGNPSEVSKPFASEVAPAVDNMTGAVGAHTDVVAQPGVSPGRLCLLLLNVVLLLACVTLTVLNRFAPVQGHGVRSVSPTATTAASAPARSGIESNSDLAPQATPTRTAEASATAGHTATYASSTPTAVPPTPTPSPVVRPSPTPTPTVTPTPCAGGNCG